MSTLILKGRWLREAHGRSFQGVVQDPGHTGLHPGDALTVTFEAGTPAVRVSSPQAHGRYHLGGGLPDDFVLVSFVRKDGGHDARALQEAGDQLWGGEVYRAS